MKVYTETRFLPWIGRIVDFNTSTNSKRNFLNAISVVVDAICNNL